MVTVIMTPALAQNPNDGKVSLDASYSANTQHYNSSSNLQNPNPNMEKAIYKDTCRMVIIQIFVHLLLSSSTYSTSFDSRSLKRSP